MKIISVQKSLEKNKMEELQRFEQHFSYPLDKSTNFRIEHGLDYSLFFRSIGQGISFLAEIDRDIVASIGLSKRRVLLPSGEITKALYIGDLKIIPEYRRGKVLWNLVNSATEWIGDTSNALGLVMKGTSLLPNQYTGKAGVPPFEELGKSVLYRLKSSSDHPENISWRGTQEEVTTIYEKLMKGRMGLIVENPYLRSLASPIWLRSPQGDACGILEDTRKAKRLFRISDNKEIISTHLGQFTFSSPKAGAELIHQALHLTSKQGIPAMFLALPQDKADEISSLLMTNPEITTTIGVYGNGISKHNYWHVNSSEV